MALPIDVTDPGNSNVETQAFGRGLAADITPGSDVAEQFSSASVVNAGISRVGPAPDQSEPSRRGPPVDVDTGDDVVEQATSATPLRIVSGDGFKPGLGVGTDSTDPGMTNVESQAPVGLGLPAVVSGDASFPQRGAAANVIANNVAGQVFGRGLPSNVFV